MAASSTVKAVNEEAVVERLLGEIFESKEAAKRDPEPEQLNNGFQNLIKADFTKIGFV